MNGILKLLIYAWDGLTRIIFLCVFKLFLLNKFCKFDLVLLTRENWQSSLSLIFCIELHSLQYKEILSRLATFACANKIRTLLNWLRSLTDLLVPSLPYLTMHSSPLEILQICNKKVKYLFKWDKKEGNLFELTDQRSLTFLAVYLPY